MTSVDAYFGRVAVLCGGKSSEREISLKSGAAVFDALKRLSIHSQLIDVTDNFFDVVSKETFDRAFIAMHGSDGEDGSLQGALKLLKIPFTGSHVLASALAMDKTRSKEVWFSHGLATPDYIEINSKCCKKQKWGEILSKLGGTVIIKPCREGSSIGISSVNTEEALKQASCRAFDFDDRIIIERKLTGQEYTVAIIADQTLPSICVKTNAEFYDFKSKYKSTSTEYLCPSGLSKRRELALQAFCFDAYSALGCTGWGRVDVITDDKGLFYLLEVNTVPGMTKSSLVPKAAEAAGIKFDDAVYQILETSLS